MKLGALIRGRLKALNGLEASTSTAMRCRDSGAPRPRL
jgi:hypothetical protein